MAWLADNSGRAHLNSTELWQNDQAHYTQTLRDNQNGPHPVGGKSANAFELRDMLGNVSEWVGDWLESDYYSHSPDTDPPGPAAGTMRVKRGGSWYNGPRWISPSRRHSNPPATRNDYTGFRCAGQFASRSALSPRDCLYSPSTDRPPGVPIPKTPGPWTNRRERECKSVAIFDGVRFRSAWSRSPSAAMPVGYGAKVLLQSRTGEWWAATRQGLCRYPAMKAAELDRRNPLACYSSDTPIFRIFEDSKGGIWASARFQPGLDKLMRWDQRTKTLSNSQLR